MHPGMAIAVSLDGYHFHPGMASWDCDRKDNVKALTSEILQLKAVVAVLQKEQRPSLEQSTPTSDSQASEVLDVNNPTAEGKLPWNIVVKAKKGW